MVKIEEVKYSQGFTSEKFEPSETITYLFKNGKLVSLETQYSKDKVTSTFEYNAKGKPTKYAYFTSGTDKVTDNVSAFSYDKKENLKWQIKKMNQFLI